jgi:hypothetical protein
MNYFKIYNESAHYSTLEQLVTHPIWMRIATTPRRTASAPEVPTRRSRNGGYWYQRWLYFKILMINLSQDNEETLCVHLSREHYIRGHSQPDYYTLANVKWVLKTLEVSGLLSVTKGRFNSHDGGTLTEISSKGELKDLIAQARLLADQARLDIKTHKEAGGSNGSEFSEVPDDLRKHLPSKLGLHSVIRVTRKDELGVKRRVPFEMTPKLRQFETWLRSVPESFEKAGVQLSYRRESDGKPLVVPMTLHSSIPERVLHMDRGFRFYHRLQFVKKKTERPTIRINGKPCAEVDFTACHLSMLYRIVAGVRYDHDRDFYSVVMDEIGMTQGDRKHRALVKMMVNMAINAESSVSALRAFNQQVRDDWPLLNTFNEFMGIERDRGSGRIIKRQRETRDILDAILKVHAPIAPFISSGVGVVLMALESEIMREIMNALWFNPLPSCKIPVLPIHDGALVPLEAKEMAEVTMVKKFEETLSSYTRAQLDADLLTASLGRERHQSRAA